MRNIEKKNCVNSLIDVLENKNQINCFTNIYDDFSLIEAYEISSEIKTIRQKNSNVIGRKLGFTNKSLMNDYNIDEIIIGYMFENTVFKNKDFNLSSYCEPKIEPEMIFKIKKPIDSSMTDHELLNCISHYTFGFEIVQSAFKNWKFKAPDTVAAFGLHGALIFEKMTDLPRNSINEFLEFLNNFDLDLFCDGSLIEKGFSKNILNNNPLEALRQMEIIIKKYNLSPLKSNDLVSTGTLTKPYNIKEKQEWKIESKFKFLKNFVIKF